MDIYNFDRRKSKDKEQLYKELCKIYEGKISRDKSKNIIIGNIEKADVIVTAHYDMFLDNISNKIVMFMKSDKIIVKIDNKKTFIKQAILLLLIGLVIVVPLLFIIILNIRTYIKTILCLVYIIILYWPFNYKNVKAHNDNSSGVDIALRFANKNKVAVVLFNNEEKGYWGARAFKKHNKIIIKDKLIINLDTVGDGELICLSPSNSVNQLCNKIIEENNMLGNIKVFETMLPGDHRVFANKNFNCIGVSRADYDGNVYYSKNIHSAKDNLFIQDTNCEYKLAENIENNLNNIEKLVKKIIDKWLKQNKKREET